MERWNKAYYCEKHDLVFIPGEPDSVRPVNRFVEILGPGAAGGCLLAVLSILT
jgi:hypothetical protein